MASREIRDLSPATQVLWNKFHDRCRRDTELLKGGYSVLLSCTYRPRDEQERLRLNPKAKISARGVNGKPSSSGFEIVVTQYCRPISHPVPAIIDHATNLGLSQPELYYYEV